MKQFFKLFAGTLLLCLSGCSNFGVRTFDRPMDPWVFRSVLDEQPRMITIALHDDLWVAYNTESTAIYKAWKGGANLEGAVYNTVHGPQPTTTGKAYFTNQIDQPWKVIKGGETIVPEVIYKGHSFLNNQVWINYVLRLKDGAEITVSENPEYISGGDSQTGLERNFKIGEVDADVTLTYESNFSSILEEGHIKSNGDFEIKDKKATWFKDLKVWEINGILTMKPGASVRLTSYFTKNPLIENPNDAEDEETEEIALGAKLINQNACRTCHNTHQKTIGPSYVDVAKKYANTEENINMLVSKVKNGGSGVWGETMMNAHPNITDADLLTMVTYIMDLDADEESENPSTSESSSEVPSITKAIEIDGKFLYPGVVVKAFKSKKVIKSLDDVSFKGKPDFEGIIPRIAAADANLIKLESNTALEITGYLNIPKTTNYLFRLRSDDGSRLYIGDQLIIDHDGWHGADIKDGEVALIKGLHPFRVEYFQAGGGKSLHLYWTSFNNSEFEIIPPTVLMHHKKDEPPVSSQEPLIQLGAQIPGDGAALVDVHPSFDLSQARPNAFAPKVGGMDFLSDGRLVISTWDSEGNVYILENTQSKNPEDIQVKKIASGLAEPLGLKVVDDEIYVLQKQELTQLIDLDGDEIIDEYRTICNSWQVSANFHEFAFGLAYKDGFFYGCLAIGILPGGASAPNQKIDRGKVFKISKETGEIEFIARGLRTPNGIGLGINDEIFVADNQGDWLPSSKILHITEGDFFGSRAVDSTNVANLPVKLPVTWLPQDEIGNSPTTPLAINVGPYAGQMIHGEVTHGGVKRVFVEQVNGQYQGALFRFIQGLEAGVNRMVWGPDDALYIGGVGSNGNWSQNGKNWFGLQRLAYNEQPTFEMLAVRAKTDGLEIELTQPLAERFGADPSDYKIEQWYYLPTNEYGGPKLGEEKLLVRSIHFNENRKKIFLEIPGIKANHVVYIRLPYHWTSSNNLELWSTETWYTMNQIPADQPGFKVRPSQKPLPNTLTQAEKQAGWQLLFDGKTTNGWRNYRQKNINNGWQAKDGTLAFNPKKKNGGDIITEGQYENFELILEWKISPCGNSGIFFNVVESENAESVYHTGPEMQVLDNTCHPDARIETHRAGDLYDMIACKYETVKPAGQWNEVRLLVNNGKVEQWLNGKKLVEYEMFTEAWTNMIANSKFKDMPEFGKARKGHIALQDHSDPVWFRNIKIREL